MHTETYKAKSGLIQHRPVFSEDESPDRDGGLCLACGCEANGVEPDARKYKCDNCGAEKVYGFEELFVMGLAKIAA